MGEVSITLGGRSFKLGCDDGEEAHLLVLADHLDKHVQNLRVSLGKTGEDQLFLMAGLMVCDELWDSRNELNKLEQKIKSQVPAPAIGEVLPPRRDQAQPAQTRELDQELVTPAPATRPAAAPPRTPCSVPHAAPAPLRPPKTVTKQT